MYSEKVMDHFRNPRNMGEIDDPDGVGRVGNPICGDLLELRLKIKGGIIEDIKFKTFGCGAAIATSSVITEMVKGKPIEEALKVTKDDVAEELGGLPPIKMHCSNLATDVLYEAIEDYKTRQTSRVESKKEAKSDYDVIVVGGGPGGLATGIECGYRGLKTVVFEKENFGGIFATLCPDKIVDDFPGVKIPCMDLVDRWVEEAQQYGVDLRKERVIEVTPERKVQTDKGEYRGRIIVLAPGSTPSGLGVRGETKFSKDDKGVYYGVSNPQKFTLKKVVIVGGGNAAVDAALTLTSLAHSIKIVHRRDQLRASERKVQQIAKTENVEVLFNTELQEIHGGEKVEKVVLKENKESKVFSLDADAVILAVGLIPNTEVFKKLGLELDDRGLIKTDKKQRTNLDGIYAVGDIVSPLALAIVAVAQGTTVAQDAYSAVRKPYWATQ